MAEQMKFCPYCGKKLSIDAPFCPYCGKKLTEGDGLPNAVTENRPQTEAPKAQRTDSSNNQKTYIALVLAIIVAGVLFMVFNDNKSNIATNNGSVNTSVNNQKRETKDDIIAKYTKPDLKFSGALNKKAFKDEAEVFAKVATPLEKIAKDAITRLTLKEQRVYCTYYIDYYEQPNKEYLVYAHYYFPDTVTYPQKDLMDYWEMQIDLLFINDKAKKFAVLPTLEHTQYNKKTNEYRVIERARYGFKDGKPKLLTSVDVPSDPRLNIPEEDKKFVKAETPWQQIKNERMRIFYEVF